MKFAQEILQDVRESIEHSKKQKRKRLFKTCLTTLCVVMASVIACLATFGFLRSLTNNKNNELAFGKTKITIVENEDYDWQAKEVKLVCQTGDGYVPGIARAMLVPYIVDSNGSYIPCDLANMSKPVNNKMVMGDIIFELDDDWENNWFYSDGYFYHKTVLYPTETGNANQSAQLLAKVSLTDDALVKYADVQIKVEVLADILQAEGTAAAEWGVAVDGSTVARR